MPKSELLDWSFPGVRVTVLSPSRHRARSALYSLFVIWEQKHCRVPGLDQREHLILYQNTQPAPTSDTCLVPAEAMPFLFWYVIHKISHFCFLTTSWQLIPSVPILKSPFLLLFSLVLLVLSLPPTTQPHLYLVCPDFYAKGLNHHLIQI